MPDNSKHNEQERSESGAPIYRHQPSEKEFEPAQPDDAVIEQIADHIERYVGESGGVFHEILSHLVHVDVHMVPPTGNRNFTTLITSGMSDRPMAAPPDVRDYRFAEVMICLPPDWPLAHEDFEDENNYWPIRWLKMLARLPHEYDTWLWVGHTVPNGDPLEPFADNTDFCCALILEPVLFDSEFRTLQISPEKTIHFLSLVPLYQEEMEFKLREGLDPLIDKLDEFSVTELLDINRPNVCAS